MYTTDLLPKGKKEVEQWLTWKGQKNGGSFNMLEARTAFEYGLSDNLQVAFYVNYSWAQAFHNGPDGTTTVPEPFLYDQPGPDEHYSAFKFVSVAGEGIYRILSPYIHPIGLALYFEPLIGPEFFEFESRVILQKNFLDDTLVSSFNFTYAPEFRQDANSGEPPTWNEEADVNFTLGTSYRFMRNVSAGVEFTNEEEYTSLNFSHLANSAFYLGPSLHYGAKKFFVTLVYFRQLPIATYHSDTTPGSVVNGYNGDVDFEKNRIRLKVGFYF